MKKSAGDTTILHMFTKKQTHMRYGSWDTEWENLLSFWSILCPLTPSPPNNPENQSFEKMKKASEDFIILHLCTKNHNHMMYACWYMECDRHIFCHFRPFFSPFTKLLTLKIKIWKKKEGHLSFYTCVPYMKIIRCMVPEIKGKMDVTIYCPLTLTNQKIKIWKNGKNTWRYYHFTLVYHNENHVM